MLDIRTPGDLLPGDVGFGSIRGQVGAAILASQAGIDIAALLRGRRSDTSGWITHAFVVVDPDTVVEAEPAGATTGSTSERLVPGYAYARMPLTEELRVRVAKYATEMVGTPYGFAQYLAIAALTIAGGQTANPCGVLARAVQRRRPDGLPARAICSQLVDEAYRLAGVQLFNDGRPAAYVTPGALFWRVAQIGEVCIL